MAARPHRARHRRRRRARAPLSLRVEGGEDRGRRLLAPAGIRPTQGLIKAAIFDMLGPRILEARALDLYAGSGGLGIEALSRGAAHAVFVERSAPGVRAIRANLAALGYEARAKIVQSEARRWLASAPAEAGEATLALLDPPYGDPDLDAVLAALAAQLPAGATVVVEHAARRQLAPVPHLSVDRVRRHGDTSVTIARIDA